MDFSYKPLELATDSLYLSYFLVTWDTEIFGFPVGQIEKIEVRSPLGAQADFAQLQNWIEQLGIRLISCRIRHSQSIESHFLQRNGFHFIELNYLPELGLAGIELSEEPELHFRGATKEDLPRLLELATQIFVHGRIHADPALGAGLGNARYRFWMLNAFEVDHQRVVVCVMNGQIAAFFVIEPRGHDEIFWSLVGLSPELHGKGWGKRIWRAMLGWHRRQGVMNVSTSISSLNNAVLNLYARLGFRFPSPDMTFHWHVSRIGRQ